MSELMNAAEYEAAAKWCAARGLTGTTGDLLPPLLSEEVRQMIQDEPDMFAWFVEKWVHAIAESQRKPEEPTP